MQMENYRKQYLIGFILTVLILAGTSLAWINEPARMETAAEELNNESILRGRALYVDNCTSCHGTRGEGGVGSVLNSKTLLETATDEVLFATITAGRPGTTMPAWGQQHGGPLTNEDIADMVNFIRAWEPNAPVVEIAGFEPSASRGATLFANTCFICHGEDGSGTEIAPAINDRARLSSLDNDWYRATIINGRPAKGMPTWGTVLAPNQIEDLLALIDAWRVGEDVAPEASVADLLDSALFTLSQADAEDALFYLDRAMPLAFGPIGEQLEDVVALIESDQLNEALTQLNDLRTDWPIGDPVPGADLYADLCASCHGGEGQGGVGLRLNPNEYVQTSTNAELLLMLQQGREGTAMRGFSELVSERQIADIMAFLREWQPNSSE